MEKELVRPMVELYLRSFTVQAQNYRGLFFEVLVLAEAITDRPHFQVVPDYA